MVINWEYLGSRRGAGTGRERCVLSPLRRAYSRRGGRSACVCAASRRRIVFHAALAREVGMRERTGERGTCGCLDLVDVVFSAGAVCNFVCILHLVWSRVCCLKCWSTLKK